MSTLPVQTFSSPGRPLYYPIGQPIVVPSIVASTITGQEIEVSNSTTAGWGVVPTGVSSIAETMIVQSNGDLLHIDIKDNNVNSTIQTFTQGFPANSSNYIMNYSINTPSGQQSTVATILLLSSIGPGSDGGIELKAQDGTSVIVGGESVYSGITSAGDYLLQSFIPPSDAFIAHYSDGSLYNSQILFSGGTGGSSTITLQSGSGNVGLEVGQAGITLNPSSNAVTLLSGTLDLNSRPMSNVSSINGSQFPPVSYIDPYGASPIFSTVASSAAAVPMIPFSTIAGKVYQVSVEYSAANGGGGAATDSTAIGITNSNSGTGLYGRFIGVNTWITDQTYDGYRANVTAIFPANSNNSGQSMLELLNVTAGTNVQIVTLEQLTVKDLGVPVNVF